MPMTIEDALEYGICDLWTQALGLRPHLTAEMALQLALSRFDWIL